MVWNAFSVLIPRRLRSSEWDWTSSIGSDQVVRGGEEVGAVYIVDDQDVATREGR